MDPSELVVGRRYLIKFVQDDSSLYTGILLRVDDVSFTIRVIYHRGFGEGTELVCPLALVDRHFFNLDEVMEEV